MTETAYNAMPRRRTSGAESAVVLGDAFHQVAQGLVCMQEALRLQAQEAMRRQEEAERREQETERRLQEALRLQEQRAATALREAVGQMEAKLQEKDDSIRALEQRLEETLQRVTVEGGREEGALRRQEQEIERRLQEQRAASALREAVGQLETAQAREDEAFHALEQRLEETQQRLTVGGGRPLVSGDEGALMRLEDRMQRVEASLQRTMQKFFPRVDGLLRQLEETPPPRSVSSSLCPSTSAGRSLAQSKTEGEAARGLLENQTPLTSRICAPTTVGSSTRSVGAAGALRATVTQEASGDRRGEPGAGQGSGAPDERLQKQQVERRIRKAKQRISAARATPSQPGEHLLKAVGNGRLVEIERLLDAGADVNYINRYGIFPLKRALEIPQSEDMVALLLRRGARPDAVNDRGTCAMHEATWNDHSRYVELVIAAGGDVDARDWLGRTPLHWAAEKSNAAAVRALLAAGARRDLKGWGGCYKYKTPFAIATTAEMKDLLRL